MKYYLPVLIFVLTVSSISLVSAQVNVTISPDTWSLGALPEDTTVSIILELSSSGHTQGPAQVKLACSDTDVTVPNYPLSPDAFPTVSFHPRFIGCFNPGSNHLIEIGIEAVDPGVTANGSVFLTGYSYSRNSPKTVYSLTDTVLDYGANPIRSDTFRVISLIAPLDSGFRFPFKFENLDNPFTASYDLEYSCDGGPVWFYFSPFAPGIYLDTVLFVTGLDYSDTSRLILKGIATSLSVEAKGKSEAAIISPNPSNGDTQIQLLEETSRWRYTLYNALGQEVIERSGFNGSKGTSLKLNIGDIPAGAYTFVLLTDKGLSAQKMIVVR